MPSLNVELMGHFTDLDARLGCVAVQDQCAYIGAGRELITLDIHDPRCPTILGRCNLAVEWIRTIALAGQYAYVGADDSLIVVDIGDPTRARKLSSYGAPYVLRVVAAPPYVYAAACQLHIVDVTDPAQPAQVGMWDDGLGAWALAVANGYAYLSDGGGLRVIDVTEPTAPREVCWANAQPCSADAVVQDRYLYLAGKKAGLRIVDVGKPASSHEVGYYIPQYATPDDLWPHGRDDALAIAVSGNLAYMAFDSSGLHIVDVADPTSSTEVALYRAPSPVDVAVAGGYVYLATSHDGLHILRASPSQP